MKDMDSVEMAINTEDLEKVSGGVTVICNIKKTIASLATLWAKGAQSAAQIADSLLK